MDDLEDKKIIKVILPEIIKKKKEKRKNKKWKNLEKNKNINSYVNNIRVAYQWMKDIENKFEGLCEGALIRAAEFHTDLARLGLQLQFLSSSEYIMAKKHQGPKIHSHTTNSLFFIFIFIFFSLISLFFYFYRNNSKYKNEEWSWKACAWLK